MKIYKRVIGTNLGYCQNNFDFENVKRYLNDRIKELENLSNSNDKNNRNPLIFTLCLSYIDFLCSHVNNSFTTNSTYKKFIKKYLKKYNIQINKKEFTEILYGLRCGCVHNYAIQRYLPNGNISNIDILLTNKIEALNENLKHLEKIKIEINGNFNKAIIIIAEDFVSDLKELTKIICDKIDTNKTFKNKIVNAFNRCPPIGWYGYSIKS